MDTAFYVQTEEGFAAEAGKLTGLLFTVSLFFAGGQGAVRRRGTERPAAGVGKALHP